jgi:hypothetical protein
MDADCSRGAGSAVKIINIVLLISQFEHSTTSGTLSALFFFDENTSALLDITTEILRHGGSCNRDPIPHFSSLQKAAPAWCQYLQRTAIH